jgi:hypothetical protein
MTAETRTSEERAQAKRQRRAFRNLRDHVASEQGKAYALADLESAERRRRRHLAAMERLDKERAKYREQMARRRRNRLSIIGGEVTA